MPPVSCPLCGASLEGDPARCPYAVPLDEAPGIGDPSAIASGKETHTDHELRIARWRIHHPAERGATPAVMAWARDRLARAGHVVPGSG
jgi:hypothetical protein